MIKDRFNNLAAIRKKRKELRNNLSPAEAILWNHLKQNKLLGIKFRRQHTIGRYILDVYCPKRRLAVELDGSTHDNPQSYQYDQGRTDYLISKGITVVRILNKDIYRELEGVLLYIKKFLSKTTPSAKAATPPWQEGR